MRIKDSIRRYMIFGITLFVVIGLIAVNIMGKAQDKVFTQDAEHYYEIISALQEGHFETALEESSFLQKNHDDSEVYNYAIGLTAANLGDIEKSVRHFQRILDINPHKVEDSMFMLQYAELLFSSRKMEEAWVVLERCASLPTPETYLQYQERVAQLQEQIAEQS